MGVRTFASSARDDVCSEVSRGYFSLGEPELLPTEDFCSSDDESPTYPPAIQNEMRAACICEITDELCRNYPKQCREAQVFSGFEEACERGSFRASELGSIVCTAAKLPKLVNKVMELCYSKDCEALIDLNNQYIIGTPSPTYDDDDTRKGGSSAFLYIILGVVLIAAVLVVAITAVLYPYLKRKARRDALKNELPMGLAVENPLAVAIEVPEQHYDHGGNPPGAFVAEERVSDEHFADPSYKTLLRIRELEDSNLANRTQSLSKTKSAAKSLRPTAPQYSLFQSPSAPALPSDVESAAYLATKLHTQGSDVSRRPISSTKSSLESTRSLASRVSSGSQLSAQYTASEDQGEDSETLLSGFETDDTTLVQDVPAEAAAVPLEVNGSGSSEYHSNTVLTSVEVAAQQEPEWIEPVKLVGDGALEPASGTSIETSVQADTVQKGTNEFAEGSSSDRNSESALTPRVVQSESVSSVSSAEWIPAVNHDGDRSTSRGVSPERVVPNTKQPGTQREEGGSVRSEGSAMRLERRAEISDGNNPKSKVTLEKGIVMLWAVSNVLKKAAPHSTNAVTRLQQSIKTDTKANDVLKELYEIFDQETIVTTIDQLQKKPKFKRILRKAQREVMDQLEDDDE